MAEFRIKPRMPATLIGLFISLINGLGDRDDVGVAVALNFDGACGGQFSQDY